jgi:hypothetical protein
VTLPRRPRVILPPMPDTPDPAAFEAWLAECAAIERSAMLDERERIENPFGDEER